MATVALASKTFTLKDDGSHLRDASFSSYLSSGEEAFIRKLNEPTRIPTSAVAAVAGPPYKLSSGRKYNEDGELDIFSAEKYFNGVVDEIETGNAEKGGKQHPNKEGKTDLQPQPQPQPRKALKSGTPSASSEVSWNSQSALLQKNRSPNTQKRKKIFGSLGCKCAGKKSVSIAENVDSVFEPCKKTVELEAVDHAGKTRTVLAGNKQFGPDFHHGQEIDSKTADKGNVGLKIQDRFTFPNLNSVVGNLTFGKQFEEEKERISLEVFGSSSNYMVKEDNTGSNNLHRKLSMLSLDTGSRRQLIEDGPPAAAAAASSSRMENVDLESDASSDLFEIESFSSKVHHPFFHPQAPEDMSSCYEPSEASIEWSVVTASAANFSAASDYDNDKPTEKIITTATDKAQRRQPASLLGCRSSKAVTVAANAQRVSEKSGPAPRRQLQSAASMLNFQAADHRHHAFAMYSIPRSYPSSHPPHSLYMH